MKRRATIGAGILVAQTLLPPTASACSCPRVDMVPATAWRRQVASILAANPIAIEGQYVAVERPLRCRLAPLRWAYAFAGGTAPVRFTVIVDRVVRGRVPRTIVVEHTQQVGKDGCFAQGSPACDPAFRPGRQTWILRRDGAVYRRAAMCSQRVAAAALGLPVPPI